MPGRIEPKKSQYKSSEFVVDSDSEDNVATDKPAAQEPSLKRKLSTPVQPAAKKAKHSAKAPSRASTSKSESDLSSASSSSSVESENDEEVETRGSSEGETSSQSSESDDNDDGSVEEPTNTTTPPQNDADQDRSSTPTLAASQAREESAFKPPEGFELLSSDAQRSGKLRDLFNPSSLEGKQLWHITAPASISIDSLSTVVLEDIRNKKPLLEFEGEHYGFRTESKVTLRHSRIMLPGEGDDAGTYILGPEFAEAYHLERIMPPAAAQAPRSNLDRESPLQSNVPRRQPDGLRTRYYPPGFEEEPVQARSIQTSKKELVNGGQNSKSDTSSSDSDSSESSSEAEASDSSKAVTNARKSTAVQKGREGKGAKKQEISKQKPASNESEDSSEESSGSSSESSSSSDASED